MSWITARRRHPAAGYAVLLLALVLIGAAYAAFAGHGTTASAAANPPGATKQQLAYGRQLFEVTCATCHGIDAQGSARGPSLIGVGAAAVDFQISTGRMPAKEIGAQMQEKRPVMNRTQTLAVANYIASLGEAMLTGPEAMPVFSDSTVTPDQKRAIIRYVTQTRSEPNPGGFSLGRVGPVTEGIVGWLAGIGLLILAGMWITAKQREQ